MTTESCEERRKRLRGAAAQRTQELRQYIQNERQDMQLLLRTARGNQDLPPEIQQQVQDYEIPDEECNLDVSMFRLDEKEDGAKNLNRTLLWLNSGEIFVIDHLFGKLIS